MELVLHYGQTNEEAEWLKMWVSFPVALLNAVFYWWTFISLYATVQQLKARRQDIKLWLYTRYVQRGPNKCLLHKCCFSLFSASGYNHTYPSACSFAVSRGYFGAPARTRLGGFGSFAGVLVFSMVAAAVFSIIQLYVMWNNVLDKEYVPPSQGETCNSLVLLLR